MVNNCFYHVEVCYYCNDNGGPRPSEISIIGFNKIFTTCTQTWSFQQVCNYLYANICNYDFLYSHFCVEPPPGSIPNCLDGASDQFIIIKHWNCWRQECYGEIGNTHITFRPCNTDSYCEETRRWCWEEEGIGGTRYMSSSTFVQRGSFSCPVEAENVTPPSVPGQVSDCFRYRAGCN